MEIGEPSRAVRRRISRVATVARSGRRTLRIAAVLAAIASAPGIPGLRAQDDPPPPAEDASPAEEPAADESAGPPEEAASSGERGAPPGDAYKPLGPNLFPFYVHELRTADNTEIRQVLGLYSRHSRPDGTGSTMLLPFFYTQHEVDPRDDRLYLFPLYYDRRSDEVDYRHIVPFFFSHRRGDRHLDMLVPFWFGWTSDAGALREDHVLFPLLRARSDRRSAERPVFGLRFGLWKVLEFFEHRRTPTTTDTTAFNLFSWGEEARSGVALYHSTWVREEQGVHGRTHLFPLYFHGAGTNSSYRWVVPLFGYDISEARSDFTAIPLLSRIGFGPGEARRYDFLFPMFHYARDRDSFSIASYPFFDYYTSPDAKRLGILFWLYRQYEDRTRGRSVWTALFPLSYFSREPDDRAGTNWALAYVETWNQERRHRLLAPIFYRWDRLTDGETDAFFTYGVPTYFSWGSSDAYFSMGIPLFWRDHENGSGWAVFFPFFWNFYSRISNDLHLVPLFSYRSTPYRRQFIHFGPLYIHERHYDLEENLEGTGHHLLWPLFKVENRASGFDLRFLPFFWITRLEDTRGYLISPFYFQQTSPEGTFRYVFPFYARFRSPRESRDVWFAGLKARHEVRRDDASLSSEVDHYAWWLATISRNHATDTSHQRILPLAYWNTDSPASKRRIAGPFYYGHRIASDGEIHSLDLILGNLFLSKTVDEIAPIRDTPIEESNDTTPEADAFSLPAPVPSPPGAADESIAGSAAESNAQGNTGAPLRRLSSERGVLWPLSRWYSRSDGTRGQWILPFYANLESHRGETLSLFPLYFGERQAAGYAPNYFRYFFLIDRERYGGGHRFTLGQLLFDYKFDEQDERRRFRFLYPLFEFERSENSFEYQITPLLTGSYKLSGGERESRHRFFPVFWRGKTERLDAEGNWKREADHFLIFPLFGYERRATQVDYRIFYPLFHMQRSPQSLSAELWPLVFYRRNPALDALRIWPFHAHETGETAGDFWVSKYLFLSKYFGRESASDYRLDPFLFRLRRGENEFGIGGLFEAFAYDRKPDSVSFRAIPFAFGSATEDSAMTAMIPFHYNENFGARPLDDGLWPRIFFLSSLLKDGHGARHFSILTKLFEHLDDSERPEFSETRFLHRLVFHRQTETSKQLEVHPFFTYYRDDTERESSLSILLSLYRQKTRPDGAVERTLFYFIRF